MARLILLLLLCAGGLWATIRLYLKDGTFHIVREYQVLSDRVKYYSTERGEWEEIPVEMVDLKRTKEEVERKEAVVKEERKAEEEEDKAEREQRKEIRSVPEEPGPYWIVGNEMRALKLAECKFVVNKKREILKRLSPIPMVLGKATLETDGDASAFVIKEERPEFYFRLSQEQRLAIFRLTPTKKGSRIVEEIAVAPVIKEIEERPIEVETFRRQVGELLFKIWPVKPLEPGEYALVQYSPAIEGRLNLQVWDFAIRK
jgi:hypothetical protein